VTLGDLFEVIGERLAQRPAAALDMVMAALQTDNDGPYVTEVDHVTEENRSKQFRLNVPGQWCDKDELAAMIGMSHTSEKAVKLWKDTLAAVDHYADPAATEASKAAAKERIAALREEARALLAGE
jgi:hypothetical protein